MEIHPKPRPRKPSLRKDLGRNRQKLVTIECSPIEIVCFSSSQGDKIKHRPNRPPAPISPKNASLPVTIPIWTFSNGPIPPKNVEWSTECLQQCRVVPKDQHRNLKRVQA
jgi:hypothetical protein